MIFLTLVFILCSVWYILRFLAHFSQKIHDFVRRLSPSTRFLYKWFQSPPVTFSYTLIFSAFTLVQHTSPRRLIDIITKHNSTNIIHAMHQPVSMFFDSAFWVSDHGAGLILYVLVFMTIIAWAERLYGSPRMLVIMASGHVLASSLTILIEIWAIEAGLAPQSLAQATDVGVSYVMLASCAAAALILKGRVRYFAFIVLALIVFLPLIITHSLWDIGHLSATVIGLIVAMLLRKLTPLRVASSPSQLLKTCREELSKL